MHSPSGADVPPVQSTGHPGKGSHQGRAQSPASSTANTRESSSQIKQILETDATHLSRIGSNRYQATCRTITTHRVPLQRTDSTDDPHALSGEITLQGVKGVPEHEKYPSWPTSDVAEKGAAAATEKASQRSKSWTDRTPSPKVQLAYARPLIKRMAHSVPQQLKTVSESPDKNTLLPEGRLCLGKSVSRPAADTKERSQQQPFPPEREREYIQYKLFSQPNEQKKLTQAELEEYTRKYEETLIQHQKQSSYAQSEGYHSYVSSTDSTSTPFLDRLRREADVTTISRTNSGWRSRDRDSVVTATSETASTSETLKWHGSLSDLSVSSSSFSSTSKQQQLIAHSSKVKTPQRHGSESVLYIDGPGAKDIEHRAPPSCQQHLKLFPISTYSVPETENRNKSNNFTPLQMSVAERVSELERQNLKTRKENNRPSCDLSLKTKQKKSVLSFYERQKKQEESKQAWRSEPHLIPGQMQVTSPTVPQSSLRRTSTASDYAEWKERGTQNSKSLPKDIKTMNEAKNKVVPGYVSDNARFSPNSILDAPVIVGSAISVDDWVPERPPKNPHLLRNAFPDLYKKEERVPSPDLPLPSPPPNLEDEIVNDDEPFPPLPAEIVNDLKQHQENLNNTSNESKSKYSPNLSVAERMLKPTPVRTSKVKHEKLLERAKSSATFTLNKENQESNLTQRGLSPLNASVLPTNQNSRPPPSNFRNDRLFRSSYRVSQETPMISSNIDIRASMRHFRTDANQSDKLSLPQKQPLSAQTNLFRSTTVDELSPKGQMNIFTRSISIFPSKPETAKINSLLPHQQKPDSRDRSKNLMNAKITAAEGCQNKETDVGAESHSYECDTSDKLVSKATTLCSYTETRVEIKSNLGSSKVSGSQEKKHSIIVKKPMLAVGPPPLYPKQTNLMKSHEIPAVPSLVTSSTRAQDTSSYTPSRATLPDSGIGSYKLINKDYSGTYSARPVEVTPSSDEKTTEFQFETPPSPKQVDETKRENKVVSSKLSKIEYLNTEKTNSQNHSPATSDNEKSTPKENVAQVKTNKEPKVLEQDATKLNVNGQTTKTTEKVENKNISKAMDSNIVSKDFSEDQTTQKILEAKNSLVEGIQLQEEPWWFRLDLEKEWQMIRRLLLTTMPPDHQLLKHPLINKNLKNPSDFLAGYLEHEVGAKFVEITQMSGERSAEEGGACGPVAASAGRRDGDAGEGGGTGVGGGGVGGDADAPSAGATPTLIDLKKDSMGCCEKMIAALKTEIESTSEAVTRNEAIGASIQAQLNPKLSARFAVTNTEVHHISALVAVLSARLARAYDDIDATTNAAKLEELEAKRSNLEEQMAEAHSLKTDIDKRSGELDAILSTFLDDPQRLRESRIFFINKAKLNIRAKLLSYRLDTARDTLRLLQNHFCNEKDAGKYS